MKCSRKVDGVPCHRHARKLPVFLVRAPMLTVAQPAAEISLKGLGFCQEHADELDPKHFFGEEGWEQICSNMEANGFMRPERRLTGVRWNVLQ